MEDVHVECNIPASGTPLVGRSLCNVPVAAHVVGIVSSYSYVLSRHPLPVHIGIDLPEASAIDIEATTCAMHAVHAFVDIYYGSAVPASGTMQ